MGNIISRSLVTLAQKLPSSWRLVLTQSKAANLLRRLSLLPFGHGLIVVDLASPLLGYRMRLDMLGGHRRFALGTYEPEISQVMQAFLKNGATALDIGANIGYFTLLMARLVGAEGRVIAFEPFLPVFSLLQENLTLNHLAWAQAECLAVSDSEGSARMESENDNQHSFITHFSETGDLTVSTISLDQYIETGKFTSLDFIKIDVEGAEDAVILGMTRTLREYHPVVLVEIHHTDGTESSGLSQLAEMGYQLQRVEKGGLYACDTLARGGYVLARWPA